jgi:hypothetical protein
MFFKKMKGVHGFIGFIETPIFHTFLAITFLLANFSHFSQQFINQHNIQRCFDTHIQILQRKFFYVILALF